jgi:hypothetical protein
MPSLDPSQSRLLSALTVTALKHLGESTLVVDEDNSLCPDWRMACVGDVALLDKPADIRSPRRIDCYAIDVSDFDGGNGKTFKLDPQRVLFSLQYKHNAVPPDFELVTLGKPDRWFGGVASLLLEELTRHDPALRETLAAAG